MIINRLVFVSLLVGSLNAADVARMQLPKNSDAYLARRDGLIAAWKGKPDILRSLRAQAFQGEVTHYDDSNKMVAKVTTEEITTYVRGQPVTVGHLALDNLLFVRGGSQKPME